MSLVHAAYIITTGGIPVIISALVEDCMSLTVANVPVVATVLIIRIYGANPRDDNDGQRWSSFKFRTRTQMSGTTPHWTSGIVTSGRGAGVNENSTHTGVTEFTGTTLDQMKSTVPTFSVGSEEVFPGIKPKEEVSGVENEQEFEQVGREERGVVRIDMLPFPLEPPPPEP